MSILSRLFPKGAKSTPPSPGTPETMASDTRDLTTGREQIVMPVPQIAFIPPAGWSPFTSIRVEQKATDVRIANPSLMGAAGLLNCITYPTDGTSPADRIEQFLTRSGDQVLSRMERLAASGIAVTVIHTKEKVPGKPLHAHVVHCYFANRAGAVVDLYCIGSSEGDALTTTDAILQTLRFEP